MFFERLSFEGETRTIGGELLRNFITHDAGPHLVGIETVEMAQLVSLSIKYRRSTNRQLFASVVWLMASLYQRNSQNVLFPGRFFKQRSAL